MKRYLENQARKDLPKKMVFIGGPRQVGKTTLARAIVGSTKNYLNWDIPLHREAILRRELPPLGMVVFDELHKFRGWRKYLKGLVDDPNQKLKILITGSARLDYYRYGGDSLQGRYHYLRLHPLSVAELKLSSPGDFKSLLTLGGFPEPFLEGNHAEARRWSREYRSRLINEDLLDVERVDDVGRLEMLMLRLPDLVGNPLSINALREDLEVGHKTLSRWLTILERLYGIFRLAPFGAPKIRAVKKEQKHYHFDWSIIPDQSLRFENLVAAHLLKWVQFKIDSEGRDLELRYFRDIDRREVDFVLLENQKPFQFIECKWNDAEINPALFYLMERFPKCKGIQISAFGKKDYVSKNGIRVQPAVPFLRTLI